MAADFVVSADNKEVVKVLKEINDAINKTAKTVEKGFDKMSDAAEKTEKQAEKTRKKLSVLDAVKFAAATVAISTLTDLVKELGQAAFVAFRDIGVGAVELNKQLEISELIFSNVFGDPKLGEATVRFLRETADQLRINQSEAITFAQSILPRTSDIETFRELLRLTDIQSDVTGKSISELEFSIREALTGDFRSIKDQFDLDPELIKRIKALGKEIGLDKALAQELGAEFERLGKADITGTLQTDLKDIRTTFTNFQVTLGEPLFDELKEQAQAFLEVLDEQGDSMDDVAAAFGELAADAIDFVGSGLTAFISSIDFEAVDNFAVSLQEALAATRLLFDIFLTLLPATEDTFESVGKDIDQITVGLVKAAIVANQLRDGLVASFLALKATIQFQQLDFVGAIETAKTLFSADTFGQEALEDRANSVTKAFERFNQQLEDINESQKERKKVTEDTTEADKAAISAAQKKIAAEREAEKAALAAGEAQEEIDKKTADAEEDRAKRLTDLLRKEADRRIDDARKAAQQREDIARDNAQAIEDIFSDNEDAIEDASTDLSREEAEIARKGARARRDIEREAANERIEIERNFRRELRRIQEDFNQTAEEAERNNDAQAFLRAVRARDAQVKEAEISRDENLEDAGSRAKQQREELQIQLAQEIEDAKIANAQKLEDLRLRLDRELEEQALKNEREIEAQTIKEQRLAQQRDIAFQRDLEALERSEADKQTRLQESLAKQFELLETAKKKELELIKLVEEQKTKIVLSEAQKRASAIAKAQNAAALAELPAGTQRVGGLSEFQKGGRVQRNRAIIVGEAGPEIYVPDSAGTIIPNQMMFSPPAQSSPLTRMISSNVTNNPVFNLAESLFQDPIARRNLTNFVLGVLAERQ